MILQDIKRVGIDALLGAFEVHEALGSIGEETVQKNQFGETALRADVECESKIIQFLADVKFPVRIVSEEHGIVDLSDDSVYLGILDGLDGSRVYKAARGTGRYGTMFGIFSGTDPAYSDYIFSGVMEHSTRRLFFAVKGKGSFMMENGIVVPIHCAEKTILGEGARIYVDEYFDINRRTFSEKLKSHGFHVRECVASSVYYVDVASGEADLALECTRKGNLEIAVAYGLVKEAGGAMLTLDGRGLAGRKYNEFGQHEQIPVITACTRSLAEDLAAHVQK